MMDILRKLGFLNNNTVDELLEHGEVKTISAGTEILREQQYVKVLPLVLDGLVKVFTRFGDREMLLYYIQPKQSCVMSLSAVLKNEPSRVFATTEEDSTILLIPYTKVEAWLRQFPDFNAMFYQQYDLRYSEMLDTIQHIMLNKMDRRLYDYLKQKTALTGNKPIKLSHAQIANELGTVREVVSRVIKKLETEGKLIQGTEGIILSNQ
jgi:CRP/FNR family transcriptional regulator